MPTTVPTTAPTTAPTTVPTETPVKKTVTLYYKSSWKNVYIHYKLNGIWTLTPGVNMTKVKDGIWKYTTELNGDNQITACFTNGTSAWDSNKSQNYVFEEGTWFVNFPFFLEDQN